MSDYSKFDYANQQPGPNDYSSLAHFRRFGLNPATALYVEVDDQIAVRVFAPSTAVTVQVSLRLQSTNGDIIPSFTQFAAPAAGSTVLQRVITGVEGFLLSASVATPGSPAGQVYVTLELIRGGGGTDATLGQIFLAGYPGSATRIGFPQSPVRAAADGRGWTTLFQVGNPAAGANFTLNIPTGEQWVLRSLRCILTTSAVVGQRVPALTLQTGAGAIMVHSPSNVNQTATNVFSYTWFAGAAGIANVGNAVICAWPIELRMQSGWQLQTITALLDVGDQYSSINLCVERFIDA
jgi:hypothetical protein